jgi:hypothetical protein
VTELSQWIYQNYRQQVIGVGGDYPRLQGGFSMTDHNTTPREISETEEQAQNPGIKEAVELYDKDESETGHSESHSGEASVIGELPFVNY